jgi:hypothetical protein
VTFGSLDNFSNSNWHLVQIDRLAQAKPHGDETQIGVSIGEGFIAVEAHDAAEVKELHPSADGADPAALFGEKRGTAEATCVARSFRTTT